MVINQSGKFEVCVQDVACVGMYAVFHLSYTVSNKQIVESIVLNHEFSTQSHLKPGFHITIRSLMVVFFHLPCPGTTVKRSKLKHLDIVPAAIMAKVP